MCQTSSAWHVFPFIVLIIPLIQTKFSSEQTDNKETVIISTYKNKMFQSKQPKKTAGKQTLPFLSRCLHLLTSAPPIEKEKRKKKTSAGTTAAPAGWTTAPRPHCAASHSL